MLIDKDIEVRVNQNLIDKGLYGEGCSVILDDNIVYIKVTLMSNSLVSESLRLVIKVINDLSDDEIYRFHTSVRVNDFQYIMIFVRL